MSQYIRRRGLLQEASDASLEGGGYQPDESSLVMGVGVGVFLLLFFGVLGMLICLYGCFIRKKPCTYCAWTTFFYGIVVIYLFAAQRRATTYDNMHKENYNDGWYAKYIVGTLLFYFCINCCVHHYCNVVHYHISALPSTYHPDFLKNGGGALGAEKAVFVKRSYL